MRRILVGVDGSDPANTALAFAADLARHYEAEVHVLAVTAVPEIGDDVETEALLDAAEPIARRIVGDAAEQLRDLRVTTVALVGHPAEQLLRYAEEHEIDHIVLGHRGRSFLDRWLLGSVSRRVVAYASCTVTITRPGR
jgi:nucleotide-binding universal stress UspA family protein